MTGWARGRLEARRAGMTAVDRSGDPDELVDIDEGRRRARLRQPAHHRFLPRPRRPLRRGSQSPLPAARPGHANRVGWRGEGAVLATTRCSPCARRVTEAAARLLVSRAPVRLPRATTARCRGGGHITGRRRCDHRPTPAPGPLTIASRGGTKKQPPSSLSPLRPVQLLDQGVSPRSGGVGTSEQNVSFRESFSILTRLCGQRRSRGGSGVWRWCGICGRRAPRRAPPRTGPRPGSVTRRCGPRSPRPPCGTCPTGPNR